MLFVLVDGLAHISPLQEFKAHIYRMGGAVQTNHLPADDSFIPSELFDGIEP